MAPGEDAGYAPAGGDPRIDSEMGFRIGSNASALVLTPLLLLLWLLDLGPFII